MGVGWGATGGDGQRAHGLVRARDGTTTSSVTPTTCATIHSVTTTTTTATTYTTRRGWGMAYHYRLGASQGRLTP